MNDETVGEAIDRRQPGWFTAAWRAIRQLRRSALHRLGIAKRTRPVVVVALEPVSADRFHAALVAAAQRWAGAAPEMHFEMFRAASAEVPSLLADEQAGSRIIVTDLDRWFWELEGCHVLYLRPGLLLLKDVFPHLGPAAGALRSRSLLECLDQLLAHFPTIRLETLFHAPAAAADEVNRLCRLDLLHADDFAAGGDGYRQAMARLLQIVRHGPFADNPAMFSFPVGGTYATSATGAGVLALGAGWSRPDHEYTWSDGPGASLAIRLVPGAAKRLHVTLNGIIAPGSMWLRVFSGGQLLQELWKGEQPHRDYQLRLSLPCPPDPDPVLTLDLEFSNTFCPKDAGYSEDSRHLGFALRSFTLTDETVLRASLRSLIGWRAPRATLTLSRQPPDDAAALGRLLVECGLSGTLITMADTQTDASLWREEGRAIPVPQFAATAGGLREISFSGTFAQLLSELAQRGSFLDLLVVSASELLGDVLDALDAIVPRIPTALPDIAVCTDDAAFINMAFSQDRARYGRVIHRFGMVTVDPQLISFSR